MKVQLREAKKERIVKGNVELQVRKDPDNTEWMVAWYDLKGKGKKLNDNKSYYTGGLDKEHKDDAIVTMKAMAKRLK